MARVLNFIATATYATPSNSTVLDNARPNREVWRRLSCPEIQVGERASQPRLLAAPLEMPERIPSSRASRRAVSMASSFEPVSMRSTRPRSRVSGMKPAPIPWILVWTWLDGLSSEGLTDDWAGFRFHAHGDDLLPAGALDVARYPGYGPAGADARNQDIHRPSVLSKSRGRWCESESRDLPGF